MKGFRHKQSLGQNFIADQALLNRLLDHTAINEDSAVLEIGAGRGDFSLAIAGRCKRLMTIEIDSRLEPVLAARFKPLPNIRLVMGDVMELNLAQLMGTETEFHVAANLPYYLTTPILNLLLRLPVMITSVNIMVQREAAQRILAQPGTPEYGPLGILTAYWGEAREAVRVPARMFTPQPKVDSSFLVINRHVAKHGEPLDEALFHRLVAAAFVMRRKTLVNNLIAGFALNREQALACLASAGIPAQVRGEALTLKEFIDLSNHLKEYIPEA